MLQFTDPIPGAMICLTDEKIAAGKDVVACTLTAPSGHRVTVNGVPCVEEEGVYRVTLPLTTKRVSLHAVDETDGTTAESEVYRLYTPRKTYRVSIDDGIWFLQDLAQNEEVYTGLFDNPYLALLKQLHEDYGTKFHINTYYTCPEHGGFSLPQLSDKYKAEWQQNSDWLSLSFHARADKPDWPYSTASYDTLYGDCKAVMDEIKRYAGSCSKATTLHFAEATTDGVRALYDNGVRALLGDFSRDEEGNIQLCYFADEQQFETVRRYCFWKNPATKMVMFCCDTVLNCYDLEGMKAELAWFDRTYPDRSFVDLLIHEQYFYEDYEAYLPDYEQRLRAGIEFCIEKGYVPGLVKDVLDFSDEEIFEPA